MQANLLLEMARLTGGAYVPAGTRAIELDRIYTEKIAPKARRQTAMTKRERFIHRYQWFVLAGVLFSVSICSCAKGERNAYTERQEIVSPLPRGASQGIAQVASLLVLPGVLCLPVPGQAASPYQAVQQGNAFYQNGKYAEAAEQYGSAARCYRVLQKFTLTRGMPRISSRITTKLANTTRRRCRPPIARWKARSNTTWAMSSTSRPYKTSSSPRQPCPICARR